MKVERALALLPPLEAIGPLRALVLSSSSADEGTRWGSAAPYLTVGKWAVSVELLRRGLPALLAKINAHLLKLYGHYADALEAEDAGDQSAVVAHLLHAARREQGVGRLGASLAWAQVAAGIAEGLTSRKAEIETFVFMGGVARGQGLHPEAARHFQRALVLAEAEFDQAGSIDASEGEGLVALELGQFQGALTWLGRAERLAQEPSFEVRRARVHRGLAEVARRQGDPDLAAGHLRTAREVFERRGESVEMARTLDAQGRLDLGLGRDSAASAAFREALAWQQRAGGDPRVECAIRLHMAEHLVTAGRITEGEEELRHAERIAITHDLGRRLIQIYTRLGALRGRQGSELGFVFFEQALALCQLLDPSPTLEAEVYHQYGLFKSATGHGDEARAWLERARELFTSVGGGPTVELIDAELDRIPA